MELKMLNAQGQDAGTTSAPETVFGREYNEALVHQIVVAYQANARQGTRAQKDRTTVKHSTRKPWRQKGTGRARHGSIRSPLWVGGGSVFGPKPRSYVQRINKKVRLSALKSALADKAESGSIFILDGFDQTKTKAAGECLKQAGITGRVLVVLEPSAEGDEAVDIAFRNLARSAFSLQGSLAAYDVVAADSIVFTTGSYQSFVERAGASR